MTGSGSGTWTHDFEAAVPTGMLTFYLDRKQVFQCPVPTGYDVPMTVSGVEVFAERPF